MIEATLSTVTRFSPRRPVPDVRLRACRLGDAGLRGKIRRRGGIRGKHRFRWFRVRVGFVWLRRPVRVRGRGGVGRLRGIGVAGRSAGVRDALRGWFLSHMPTVRRG